MEIARVIIAHQRQRLDEALTLERRFLKELCASGRVRVRLPHEPHGHAILVGRPWIEPGMELTVLASHIDPRLLPEDLPLTVLDDDDAVLFVNKPAGMTCCPDKFHPAGSLANALRGLGGALSSVEGARRPGIVHRLDLGTSGVMVVARSDAAHHALASQFANHSVARRYLALVLGEPAWEDQEITSDLARRRLGRKAFACVTAGKGKPSRSEFHVLARHDGLALVQAIPHSGRTHQIRVHLAALGHPLVGDTLYGGPRARATAFGLKLRRPALHAVSLAIDHPVTGERMTITAPPPDDLVDTGWMQSRWDG